LKWLRYAAVIDCASDSRAWRHAGVRSSAVDAPDRAVPMLRDRRTVEAIFLPVRSFIKRCKLRPDRQTVQAHAAMNLSNSTNSFVTLCNKSIAWKDRPQQKIHARTLRRRLGNSRILLGQINAEAFKPTAVAAPVRTG